ncbi:MAG TPA: ABC transporter permease subunit [Thermoanaerobaculia bacterium]|nr:ABC transporter permease subunit [Thermoanaerobaculia bacterium]
MKQNELAAVFQPNRAVSPAVMKILVAVQAAIALGIWFLSPFPVLPRPPEVLSALGSLWSEGGLAEELGTSLKLNIEAVLLTLVIALALSYLTVMPFFRPIATAVSKGRFLGLTGLTFVFTLLVGGGHPLKVALLVFGMTVFFVTSMASVVAEIPKEQFDYARTLRMGEWRVVWEVVVLGTFDKALEVLRQNAAIGWMMLTMVEGISRSEGGLGAMLLNQNKHFRLPEVFAIQIVILVVGIFQDTLLGWLGRILAPHAVLARERQ